MTKTRFPIILFKKSKVSYPQFSLILTDKSITDNCPYLKEVPISAIKDNYYITKSRFPIFLSRKTKLKDIHNFLQSLLV